MKRLTGSDKAWFLIGLVSLAYLIISAGYDLVRYRDSDPRGNYQHSLGRMLQAGADED